MKYSTTLANALANEIAAQLVNGTVKFYAGTVPTNGDEAISGQTLLGTMSLGATPFGAASGGVITLTPPAAVTAVATATCTFARWETSGAAVVFDTTVNTTGADLTINDNAIQTGNDIEITAFSFTQPIS